MTTLSERMLANVKLLTPGLRTADIGCDHAYVSIYLIERGIASYVYAMDVVPGPLSKANENINRAKLSDKIETRLSDGAKELKAGEAEAAIIAGMGGMLMEKIISDSLEIFLSMKELVLQPQSDLPHFRRFLYEKGFIITAEDMVLEDGKYYPMIKAVPEALCSNSEDTMTECDYHYGQHLLKSCHPVLKQYLLWEKRQKEKILTGLVTQSATERTIIRIQEIKKELALNEQALALTAVLPSNIC